MTRSTTIAWVTAAMILGAIPRVVGCANSVPVISGDEAYYVQTALSIARGDGHYNERIRTWAAWPPGHPFFLSFGIDGGDRGPFMRNPERLRPLVAMVTCVGIALVGLVAWLAAGLFGARAGIAAGFAAAVLPSLVGFSNFLWAQVPFTALFVAALGSAQRASRAGREGWAWAATAGVVFGLAALTRETAFPVAGGCALWLAWRGWNDERGAAILRGALMIGLCVAVVAPWTARNYAVFGRFVPVSTAGWSAIRVGNAIDREDKTQFYAAYYAIPNEMERADFARDDALEVIWAQQPGWIFTKLRRIPQSLFTPHSVVTLKLAAGHYGPLSPGTLSWLGLLIVGLYITTMSLGIVGIATAPKREQWAFLLLALAPFILLHLISGATPKHRIPLTAIFAVGAGAAIADWRSIPGRLITRAGAVGFVVLVVFWSMCAFALAGPGVGVEP